MIGEQWLASVTRRLLGWYGTIRFEKSLRTNVPRMVMGVSIFDLTPNGRSGGSGTADEPLQKLIAALSLIQEHRPVLLRWVREGTPRMILTEDLPAPVVFVPAPSLLLVDASCPRLHPPVVLASYLVHEVTRVRIWRSIPEETCIRSRRVESRCALGMREFVRLVPEAQYLSEWADEVVTRSADAAQVEARDLVLDLERQEKLTEAGVPAWIVERLQSARRGEYANRHRRR